MRAILRDRDVRLLLLGQGLSMFGDRAMWLAMAIWVKELTGSNAAAGLTFLAMNLPYLAAPAGGLLVDRVSRRRLMIAADVFIGLGVLSLLAVHGPAQLWLVYAVAFAYGTAGMLLDSSQSALLTVMLPPERLGEANGAFQTVKEGLRLIAPLAGAGIFAVLGGGAVAILDAATFACSAGCLALLRVRERPEAAREHHLLREMSLGVRHVLSAPGLRRMVLATSGTLLVVGFTETLIFAVVGQGLHRSPTFLGVLMPAQGVGAIAGGLTAAAIMRRIGDARLLAAGIAAFGVGAALLVPPNEASVIAGMVVAGLGLAWAIVGLTTGIQLRTPPALQGRAYSAADAITVLPQNVSIALGAALSTLVFYRTLLWAIVAVTVVCAAALYVGRVPPPPATEAAEPRGEAEDVAGSAPKLVAEAVEAR